MYSLIFIIFQLLFVGTINNESSKCHYNLSLENLKCNKKEVRFYKKRKDLSGVAFIKFVHYTNSDSILLTKYTKGVGNFNRLTCNNIEGKIRFNWSDKLVECDTVETYVKIDMKESKICYVKNDETYLKLKKEYENSEQLERKMEYRYDW